jgi:allantoin racemase
VLLKIINPNTTLSMTRRIGASARAAAAPGTEISAVNPSMGPASIESHYDEALSVPGILEEIERGERHGADGYVIACFGDPGLDAARERAAGPVIGIAEAAMHAAAFLGRGFSVVTTLGRTKGRAWDLAVHYGMERRCHNVRACEVRVLELDQPGSGARELIAEECRLALAEDQSDVIVLGCAGMSDLAAELSVELGVPVVDGVSTATKLVESLVTLGLRTSTRAEFARPPAKSYSGLLREFSML